MPTTSKVTPLPRAHLNPNRHRPPRPNLRISRRIFFPSGDEYEMKINVTCVDYAPPELESQAPFELEVLREIPSSDRPGCWIGVAAKPIRSLREGQEVHVTHLIVWPRCQAMQIGPGMKQMPIGIPSVTESSRS